MFMPAGEDPDSLVEKAGVAAFQQVMDASLPASAFFLQRWTTAQAHNAAPKHKQNSPAKPSAGWNFCLTPTSAKSCARR